MAFHIRDAATDKAVRELARLKGVGLTEAVKGAALAELERENATIPLRERLRPLLEEMAALPKTGLPIDKAFFDSLNDEED